MKNPLRKKILVIRFSSIGDVLQTLSVSQILHQKFPDASLQVATQSRFRVFFELQPGVEKVWDVPKKSGLKELWALSALLGAEKFTHIYDAHNNLRSRLLTLMLRLRGRPFFHLLRRPIYRWRRFLLFRFHWNLFEKPFSGQMDQLRPLKKWGVIPRIGETPSLFIAPEVLGRIKDLLKQREVGPFVALAPSAAYPLKRWPREYFEELMKRMPSFSFVLLGGPEDTFLEEMAVKGNEGLGPARVFNLAGKLSLEESAAVVFYSRALVANDTGVMHMAEQLGRPCVALMGPAPFGFPSKKSTRILERDLSCRPCSKHGQGPCVNPEYQKCLRTILPVEVKRALEDLL